jgi:hypothetical protein
LNRPQEEDPKPKALIKVEEEAENQYMQEYALFKDTSTAKTAQQIFSKLFQVFPIKMKINLINHPRLRRM